MLTLVLQETEIKKSRRNSITEDYLDHRAKSQKWSAHGCHLLNNGKVQKQ